MVYVSSVRRLLQVRAVGNVDSNRAALHATVRVAVAGQSLLSYVNSGAAQGFQGSASPPFGWGDDYVVDGIATDLSDGSRVGFDGPFEGDQRRWLYEDGSVDPGRAPG